MITYQELYDRYTALTKDDSTANCALGKALINEYNQAICGMREWDFLEKERTFPTEAESASYRLPADWGRLMDLWLVIGTQIYYPDEVFTQSYWRQLVSSSSSSDVVQKFILYSDHVSVFPTPVTADYLYHMLYRRIAKDMFEADYSTGTASVAQGSRNVTGAATVWTSAMAGRWILLGGIWHEITSVTSGTALIVEKPAIAAATLDTNYKIGEMSPIPGEFHDLLWKGPVADYFDFKGMKNPFRTQYEKRLGVDRYKNLQSGLVYNYGSSKKSTSQVIRRRSAGRVVNPNFYPSGMA